MLRILACARRMRIQDSCEHVPRLLVSLGAVRLSESAAICRRASLGSRGDGCDPQSEKPTVPDAPASRPQPARSRGGGNHWNRRRFAKSCIASIEASFGSSPVITSGEPRRKFVGGCVRHISDRGGPSQPCPEILYYCLLLTAYIRCDRAVHKSSQPALPLRLRFARFVIECSHSSTGTFCLAGPLAVVGR